MPGSGNTGLRKGTSGLRGNSHGPFLEGLGLATAPGHSTYQQCPQGRKAKPTPDEGDYECSSRVRRNAHARFRGEEGSEMSLPPPTTTTQSLKPRSLRRSPRCRSRRTRRRTFRAFTGPGSSSSSSRRPRSTRSEAFWPSTGSVLKVSAAKVEDELTRLVNDPDDTWISPFLKETIHTMSTELTGLNEKLEDFDRRIAQFAKKNPVCQRLLTVPGVGVLTATVLLALVGDPFRFKNGRQFAAFEEVHLFVIYSPDASFVRKLMNFREIRQKIVNALGSSVQKFYFASS